jgi:hypothetical protein
MSRTSGSHSRRPLAAAGVLALVGLATPARATHAQSINPRAGASEPDPSHLVPVGARYTWPVAYARWRADVVGRY